ncbi:MAG TPA: transposase [Saprospiraceae bacterium]|nr:transposase [Saprospiraceae bacterium]
MGRKRIYIPHAVYHVTFNTKFRLPYFKEDIFSCILGNVLFNAQELKDYVLIAYKINPEHVHLLIKCGDTINLSEIVHCIRRVSAIKINQVITKGTEDERLKLLWNEYMLVYARGFWLKYGSPSSFPFPLFKWQGGFDDVIMRTRQQLITVKHYIRNQASHHELAENIHLFVRTTEPDGIVYPNLKI